MNDEQEAFERGLDLVMQIEHLTQQIAAKDKEIAELKLDLEHAVNKDAYDKLFIDFVSRGAEIARLKEETFPRKAVECLIDFAKTQGSAGQLALIQFDAERSKMQAEQALM